MTATAKVLGVDGCRGGWVAVVGVGESTSWRWEIEVTRSFAELLESHAEAEWVRVDMPIGLPTTEIPQRACDAQARRLLGRYASRVFSPPCREALMAETYMEANTMNREVLGKGLSKQAWYLGPKILEVEKAITYPAWAERVTEAHPELVFAGLAGGEALVSKKTDDGQARRLNLLEKQNKGLANEVARVLGKKRAREAGLSSQPDDVIDAAALALLAARPDHEMVLGDKEAKDAIGLPQQIAGWR